MAAPSLSRRDSLIETRLFYPLVTLLIFFVVLMIKTAWVGDDAFISFRPLDNLVNGHGLRWNIAERVQVYTDPLWLFVILPFYAITREMFLTVIVLSMVVSFAAVFLIVKYLRSSNAAALAVLAALLSSRAFIDYTTSGLENSLSYLVAAGFCVCLLRTVSNQKRFRYLTLIGSLAAFNRLDLVLIFGPAILQAGWLSWRTDKVKLPRLFAEALIFSLPLWGWIAFSTIYFGFAFPNTYYAKLYTGLPKGEMFVQGILYYFNSLDKDPITLIALALALLLAIASRDPRLVAVAVGIILYLLYIVKIGGDFMSGRFFAVPLFLALGMLMYLRLQRATWIGLAVLFMGLGLLPDDPLVRTNDTFAADSVWDFSGELVKNSVVDSRGIADERAAYYQGAGLLPVLRHNRTEPTSVAVGMGHRSRMAGPHIESFETPGFFGFYAGPEVHILDSYALGDPLLSKLPAVNVKDWRIGHFRRSVPNGYIATLQTGTNVIEDSKLHELYRSIELLTRGPIWTRERFAEIAKMNLGFYKKVIAQIDLNACSAAPAARSTFPFTEKGNPQSKGTTLAASIKAEWGSEGDASGRFWWSAGRVVARFTLPDPHVPDAPLLVEARPHGKNVQLRCLVNRQEVPSEWVPGAAGYLTTRLRGPWKTGRNTVEILGTGESVRPAGGTDRRSLLFLLREPRWD